MDFGTGFWDLTISKKHGFFVKHLRHQPDGSWRGATSRESDRHASEKKSLGIVSWMCGFFIVIFLVDFHIGIILFVLAFLKVQARVSWVKASIATAIIWCVTYFLFEVALGFTMFKGLLFGELIPDL